MFNPKTKWLMKTGNNFMTKRGFPLMKVPPKKELVTDDFDEKCHTLIESILKVYWFFMWFGEKSKNKADEMRSIIFLEGLFLKMLEAIKTIYGLRGKKLYNECTDKFKDLLKKLNKRMHRGTKFIHKSSTTLETDLGNELSCVPAIRQDVVKGFRDLTGWLQKETTNPKNKKLAKKLRDELELNYEMKMYGCIGDNFEQHANMVMNGLMLLANPSEQGASADVYRDMFDNTIAELLTLWKSSFDAWKRRILKAYDLHNLVEDCDKMEFLKSFWLELDDREEKLLNKFNIEPETARTDGERSTMGQRIYEHLNGKACNKMTTDDLHQYLLYVMQKKYLDDEIDKLRPQFREEQPAIIRNRLPLLKESVDGGLLASCLSDVYCRFFGEEENLELLQGRNNDEITLMAYLYIICKAEGYLESDEKRAFYEFCKEDAGFVTATKSDRTFRNRLVKLEDVYKAHCLRSSRKPDETLDNNYHKVLRIFHGTKKYEALRKQMNG